MKTELENEIVKDPYQFLIPEDRILEIARENDMHQFDHPAAAKFCVQFARAIIRECGK